MMLDLMCLDEYEDDEAGQKERKREDAITQQNTMQNEAIYIYLYRLYILYRFIYIYIDYIYYIDLYISIYRLYILYRFIYIYI
ncbi:hypothetical protein P7K49_019972 [Saguinus oedipus]|uniref:Transmembrane protein n=1 Tax=Saguinus oedipus TaxID=9490 RepID=A0ABQ9UZ08_SAGOE|nr:hypothetical protein P7K49_019972 [Saguinus oedipus]